MIICIKRKITRRICFKKAEERAKLTGKKLLVIGDPYNGIASKSTGSDYNCGDLCIDLTGCPKCKNSIKTKLENIINKINLNEYIVYISCVLEYVDNIDLIIENLNKMNEKDLFIVNVEPYSLSAYLYPYFITKERPPRNIIYSKNNNNIKYFVNPIL